MLRLLPWSPEYGSAMQADPESFDGTDEGLRADTSVEGEWRARRPSGEPPAAVQIVDGVRRVEAHAIDDLADGETAFGLFGSYAVGAVRCEGARSWVLDGDAPEGDRLRVFRVYLQGGGEPRDQEVAAGSLRLRFRARVENSARTSNQLADVLQRSMLDAEARLAETLAEDESALTIVDGPLRLRSVEQRVAGYIKRIQSWYIAAHEFPLLGELAVGERTSLFRIPPAAARRAAAAGPIATAGTCASPTWDRTTTSCPASCASRRLARCRSAMRRGLPTSAGWHYRGSPPPRCATRARRRTSRRSARLSRC